MPRPNFFIVGKPKSGTTALHFMLHQHPDIFMSEFKEPHFFARDHIEVSMRRNRAYKGLPYKNVESYLKLFDGAGNCNVVGESSTGYLYSTVAASEIAKFNQDARILIVLRDPVDFLYSYHSQLLRAGNETIGDFRKALQLEEVRKLDEKIPLTTSNPRLLFYSEQVQYCGQIQRFLEVFDRSQIKIVIYDDFEQDNVGICQDVFQFLGVDPSFEPEVMIANPNIGMRVPWLANWLIYHGERKAGSFKDTAPDWLKLPITRVMRKLVFSGQPKSPMEPTLRSELKARYKSEVVKVGNLIGEDLVARWGY